MAVDLSLSDQGKIELLPVTAWTNATSRPFEEDRPLLPAILRGMAHRCPACGAKTLYDSYLRVSNVCSGCGEELMHHRADDAPPYFTILAAGHIVVPLLMTVELAYAPPIWLHLLIWIPLIVVLSLALLPRIKGAIVGLQWALRMHGFGGPGSDSIAVETKTLHENESYGG